MNVKLTEKAQQEHEWFEGIFLPRSKHKWDQGMRTEKRRTPPKEWEWYAQQFGPDFLVSCYNSHRYCVVTTPDEQLGMLTEELPDWIQAALKAVPRRPLAASIAAETEGPSTPMATLTEQQLVGLKGECWPDENGRIGLAVPPLGIHSNAVQWQILELSPASGKTPAWTDLVAGNLRIRINPDICQPPFWRLADCVWFASGLWQTFPSGDQWAMLSFPPEPHPHSQAFVFQRCTLHGGIEGVIIDTLDRCKQFHDRTGVRDGQHRTKME